MTGSAVTVPRAPVTSTVFFYLGEVVHDPLTTVTAPTYPLPRFCPGIESMVGGGFTTVPRRVVSVMSLEGQRGEALRSSQMNRNTRTATVS